MSDKNEWNESAFGCHHDCCLCCYGCWCFPCLFGSNAKKISNKNPFLMCCLYSLTSSCYLSWIPHMKERGKLRKKYNLEEDPCGDCKTAAFCGPCALCQEAREMKSREKESAVSYHAQTGAPIINQPGSHASHAPLPQAQA